MRRDRATEKLRRVVERRHMREGNGERRLVRPRLVAEIFGDGKELMILDPIGAPGLDYFVVRVGLGWCDEGRGPVNNAPVRKHLDDIYQSIADEFGHFIGEGDDEAPADEVRFPDLVDFSEGCHWGTMRWPKGCGPKRTTTDGGPDAPR